MPRRFQARLEKHFAVTAFLVSCHLSTWRLAIDLGLAGRNDEQQLVRTAREFGSTPNLDAST